MAIEPLNTDEKLDRPAPRPRDLDTVLLLGFGAFAMSAVGGYLLSFWPFLVYSEISRLGMIGTASAIGLTSAVVAAAISSRRFGLPGACGAVAGSLTTAIFLYLRIQQVSTAASARQAPPMEYPDVAGILVPVTWILTVATVAIVLLPRNSLSSSEE